MSAKHVYLVGPSAEGMRLDVFLSAQGDPFHSRSQVKRLIDEGRVYLNGAPCTKAGRKVAAGDRISVELPPPPRETAEPQAIPLDIVYEDDSIIVVNKPRGMVVHPAPGNPDRTLVNALLAHCGRLSSVGGAQRPGIVHRIDKETSGLIVVAKTAEAHLHLARQLKERTMGRRYIAYVHGVPRSDRGTIDAPIGRHPVHRQRMAVVEKGRPAVTHFRVLERYRAFAKIEAHLETGRTHQIRVHMAYIGHPLVGDERYGAGKKTPFDQGQALHAWQLELVHPVTGERMQFTAPLPPELVALEERLRSLTTTA